MSADIEAALDKLQRAHEAMTPGPWDFVARAPFLTANTPADVEGIALEHNAFGALLALAQLATEHQKCEIEPDSATHTPHCELCSMYWPCPTAVALAALAEAVGE